MQRTKGTGRSEIVATATVDARAVRLRHALPLLVKTAMVLTGVGVLAASAWVSVPFYPVPMTLQTLAVLLVGGLLGPRLGVAAVTAYLVLGMAGAPVFHNGLGSLAVIAGPTGGYLLGFVPAAYLMGLAADAYRGVDSGRMGTVRRWALVAAGAVFAEMVIYSLGVPWLAFSTAISLKAAATVGLTPFLLGDLVKTSIAVMTVCGGSRLLKRWGSLPL